MLSDKGGMCYQASSSPSGSYAITTSCWHPRLDAASDLLNLSSLASARNSQAKKISEDLQEDLSI